MSADRFIRKATETVRPSILFITPRPRPLGLGIDDAKAFTVIAYPKPTDSAHKNKSTRPNQTGPV